MNANLKKLALVAVAVAGATAVSTAGTTGGTTTGDEGFANLFQIFKAWLTGNLGKVLALVGFAGTFVVYMMTHKGSVLMVGIIISLIAGGLVGISDIFFDAGTTSFVDD